MNRRPKILMVYKCLGYPLRKTVDEHLYSFLRYADAECYYLKLDIGKDTFYSTEPIPNYLLEIDFDIILFHYGFISSRWAGQECYNRALQQVLPLKKSKAIKAVMPQDEYMGSKNICHFVNEMNIDIVFSVSPETEWEQLYGGITNKNVKLFKVLTGYLDDGGIAIVNNFLKTESKTIDIGYRARNLPQWLGKHGFLKTIIADEFEKALPGYNLNTDISTRPTDTFMGNEWYRFMVKCKYMIGVEGGATVHDPDGSIALKGKEYLRQNPNCTFEEIEAACFPNLDGKLQLIAISPRHLEACATRTCQVLIEGTYNGILKANVHYIPLKEDFSNIHQVLADIKNDTRRKEITDNAYRDIVASGKYCYQNFVKEVIDKCLDLATDDYFNRTVTYGKYYRKNRFQDWLSWKKDYFWHKIYDRLPTKWVILTPTIKLIKALGLKHAAKKIYFAITGKKKFP